MGQCPHCGAQREMIWNAGYPVWVCPQEHAGLGRHPGQGWRSPVEVTGVSARVFQTANGRSVKSG